MFYAEDEDHDKSALANLHIDVDDDTPELNEGNVNGAVGEDALVPDGNPDAGDTKTTIASGSLSSAVSFGADVPGTFVFGSDAVTKMLALSLTSNSAALKYAILGDTLVAYTGATNVQAGTLRVEGSTASGAVTVQSGAALAGTGVLGGPVSILSGGILAPGSAGVGTLRFLGDLTLASDSVTRIELDPVAGTRDQVDVAGALVLGGTLAVTKLGGSVAAGDAFPLFAAGARSGSFSTLDLPDLGPGLGWDGSTLATDGTLRVVAVALPDFAAWAAQQSLPAGASAAAADADGDGLANALEWILGGDPLSSDAAARSPVLALRALTAAEYPAAVEGRAYLTLGARVRRVRPGATLIPEGSVTLGGLGTPESASAVAQVGEPVADGDFDVITYVFTTPIEDSPTRSAFLRLRVVVE